MGLRFEATVGPVAHGGHFVARHEGRVVFVRHALPGERVLVEVTEDHGGAFCRGDAVEILTPSQDRVEAPCPYAGPGVCGGCDFQHVSLPAQRELKAAVIREQFQRLAHLDVTPTVEPLGGSDTDGLGWRRRIRYAVAGDGSLGLHAYRSDRVVLIEQCLIGADLVGNADVLERNWPGASEIEVAVDDHGQQTVVAMRKQNSARPPQRSGRRGRTAVEIHQVSGPATSRYEVAGHHYAVTAGGFWQTHPGAAEAFVAEVLDHVARGDRVLDLYAGAGLFTTALASAVGPDGQVVGLEGDPQAVEDALANVSGLSNASVRLGAVTADAVHDAASDAGHPDVVVLDPPRTGAGRQVMEAILALRPRAIVYVACDPAALARDVATATAQGWRLDRLRAFDAFPMTHHVECLATLVAG